MYIVLRAKSLDELCQSDAGKYFGPFASRDEAREWCETSSDIGRGRDGNWYWITELGAV